MGRFLIHGIKRLTVQNLTDKTMTALSVSTD